MTSTTTSYGGGFGGSIDPVSAGTRRALERLDRHGFAVRVDADALSDHVAARLVEHVAGAPARAVELMAEHVAIATLVRQEYAEPDLSEAELLAYLDTARAFFNSFWHDTP